MGRVRAVAFPAAMRMRQSISEIEAAFVEEIEEHRERDERIRLEAEQRTRRRATRTHRQGSKRFWILVLTLIATAVVVTIAMFQTLYYVMG